MQDGTLEKQANHLKTKLKPIHIGSIELAHPVILAPMAGVTDQPFRRLVRKFGAGLVVSEMIASQAMVRESRKTLQMVQKSDEEGISVIQLAGSDPKIMADAARQNVDLGAQIIDINFGCPAKKIVNGFAGSALMRDEPLATKIMEAIVKAVPVPITVKMRLGWNHENLNAPRLAHLAEESGIKMVTVHGRTRCQFYGGEADWAAIHDVRDAIKIPLIVNGDITDAETARRALELSGADGVMIGRGAYGKPWLLKQIMSTLETGEASIQPDLAVRYATLMEHFESLLSYYGTYTGLRIARKHIGWYSKGLSQSAEFRASVNSSASAEQVRLMITNFFQPLLDKTP